MTTKNLEVIFNFTGDDGRRVVVAVDERNRLHVNGDPLVTESKLVLDWWLTGAAVATGASTFALAVTEVGRVLNWW